MSQRSPVLQIEHLTKNFGEKRALDAVNISVMPGEVFGFLGPNGAGKSTTIRLILDVLRPDSGTVTLFGKSNRYTEATHRDIGFLSGDMVLDTDLTGYQYLQFINATFGGGHEKRMHELAEKLEAKLDVKIGNYSRGNKQKIGLIAALMHNPKLLILDEPTSGFDPLVQETFANLIREYTKAGGTVFMSSHILTEVQDLCDRVAFIKEGSIIATKDIHELVDTTAKHVEVHANTQILQKLQAHASKLPDLQLTRVHKGKAIFSYSGQPQPLLALLAGYELSDVVIREPDLEEIFTAYYMSEEA